MAKLGRTFQTPALTGIIDGFMGHYEGIIGRDITHAYTSLVGHLTSMGTISPLRVDNINMAKDLNKSKCLALNSWVGTVQEEQVFEIAQ